MTKKKAPAASPRDLKDREKLRDKLAELMALETSEWRGHPFAEADGTFGVTCGAQRGGLYAMYFLSDHLRDQGLFTGRQKARTDLDCAMYELATDNPFQPFPEVHMRWNEMKELELRITTGKPLDKIILALDNAIAAEQAEIRQKEQQEREYEEGRERDRQREKRGPVVSAHADLAILQEYVEQKVREHLPHTAFFDFASEPVDPMLGDALKDGRLRNKFRYYSSGWGKENDFFNYTLPDVFTGFCAVHANHFPPKGELHFEIAGNPARLVQDILEHDFNAVAAVKTALDAKHILFFGDKLAFEKVIADFGQKDKDASVITKGTPETIQVKRPLKLKGPA